MALFFVPSRYSLATTCGSPFSTHYSVHTALPTTSYHYSTPLLPTTPEDYANYPYLIKIVQTWMLYTNLLQFDLQSYSSFEIKSFPKTLFICSPLNMIEIKIQKLSRFVKFSAQYARGLIYQKILFV